MQKSFIEDFFERMNEKLFFLLVILVQLVFIFQGICFGDRLLRVLFGEYPVHWEYYLE